MGDIVVEQPQEVGAFAAFCGRKDGEISYGLVVQTKYDGTLSCDRDVTRMCRGVCIQ